MKDGVARQALETERDHLQVQISDLKIADTNSDFDDNFADSAQVAAEMGENRALYESLCEQLDAVETALGRMDEGTYGHCDMCNKPISEARLEALPMTTLCIDCASKR